MSEVSSFIHGVRAGVDAGAPLANAMRDRRLHQMKLEMMEREWEHDREGWAWQSREKALDREVDYSRLDIARGELTLREGQDARDATSQALDDKMKRWQLQRVKSEAARAEVPPGLLGMEKTADVIAARRSSAQKRLETAIAANDKDAANRAKAVLDTYSLIDQQFIKDPMGVSANIWGQGRTFDFTQKLPDGSFIKGKIPAGDAETLTAADLIAQARADISATNAPTTVDPVAKGLQTQATSKLNELGTAKADLLMLQAEGVQKVKPDAAGGYTKAGWLGGTPITTELDRINQQETHLRRILGSGAPTPMPMAPAPAAPMLQTPAAATSPKPGPSAPGQARPEDYFDSTAPDVSIRPDATAPPRTHPAGAMRTNVGEQAQAAALMKTNAASTAPAKPQKNSQLPDKPDAKYLREVHAWVNDNMTSKDPATKAKVESWRAWMRKFVDTPEWAEAFPE